MTKEDFEQIYRRHYPQMYRLARTMLYDADESKDVVSDIFVRLLRGDISPEAEKMEGYLMMSDIISHKSIRERVEKLFAQELTQSNIIYLNDDDRLERLMFFVNKNLTPLSQQIFQLRFLREMSYEEVAKATGVSKVTVYNHLSNALQRIHEHFEDK